MKNENNDVVSLNPLTVTGIEKMILVIRDKQVLLDRDLATLYGVETRAINQAVKRNLERFPERNFFQLTRNELPDFLKSQIVILNESGNRRGLHVKKMPFAFTEQGVAMLASVLHSETAIRVSLQIMDAFVAMRHFLMQNGGFVNRLSNVEATYNEQYAEYPIKILPSYGMHDRFLWDSYRVPTIRLSNAHASVVAPFALNGCY